MTPGQALTLAVDLVKSHLDAIPDENIRNVASLVLDMLGEGAEGNRDDMTPEQFRQQLAAAMPTKWEAMIRAKFNHDTEPSIEVPPKGE